MSTVTQAAPIRSLRAYVLHTTRPEETTLVHAVSPAAAQRISGWTRAVVHDARFTACGACERALASGGAP